MKFTFFPPKKKKIALFDAEGLKDARYILNKNDYEIIYCRKEKINIFILIKSILKKNFFFKKVDYFNEYINEINPKLIITFNDNNELFYKVNKNKTYSIAVQNGTRSYHNDILSNFKFIKDKYKISKYFVFSEYYKKELSKFIDTDFSILGSPFNNNFKKKKIEFTNNALYLSTFSIINYEQSKKDKKKFYAYYQKEINFIKDINQELKKKNVKFSILGKYKNKTLKQIEKEFYKSSGIKFIENYEDRKTYDIASKYEILIGYSSSTLTYEMLAREKKVIVLNRDYNYYPVETKKFGYFDCLPEEGVFWINSGNKFKFINLFVKIKKLSKSDWKNILKKYEKFTCGFNYLNEKLRNHIKYVLTDSKFK